MLNSMIISVIISLILGFLTGLGTGGGSLLMLWLTLICNFPHDQAKLINLMFFIPCAAVSSFINWRNGRIDWRKILLPSLAGSAAACLLSLWAKYMNTEQLQKLFGVLLIFTGLRELFYRARKPK